MQLQPFIFFGGICHFGILFASALTPGVLHWRTQLAKLPPLLRDVVWVHGAFIVLVILAFGAISLANARELSDGSALARSVCALIATFWMARLFIQLFLFDARPYLRTKLLTIGYHALTLVFAYLLVAYGAAAIYS